MSPRRTGFPRRQSSARSVTASPTELTPISCGSPSTVPKPKGCFARLSPSRFAVRSRRREHPDDVAVLVVTQFMAALTDDQGEPLLLVKGGASLELRRGIPASRTSKFLDTVSRADMATVHDQLADAGADDWEASRPCSRRPCRSRCRTRS